MASKDHYSESLLSWVQSQLNSLIGADDFAPMLLGLNDAELKEYCTSLMGEGQSTRAFVDTLITRRNSEKCDQKKPMEKKQKSKPSRRERKGNKSNHSNGQKSKSGTKSKKGTMSLNPDLFGPTTKKRKVKMDPASFVKKKNAKSNALAQRGAAMTITHSPISKKSGKKRRKKRMSAL